MAQNSISSLLKSYWIETIAPILLFGIFIILVYMSFGHPMYFDALFVVAMLAVFTTYKRNKNLFFNLMIFFIIRFILEGAFVFSDSELSKLLYYVSSIVLIILLKHDKHVIAIVAPVTLLSIGVELYWALTGYIGPDLHYYIISISLNCVLRFFLVFRSHIKWLSDVEAKSLPFEYTLYKLVAASNLVVVAMVLEYMVRHLTQLSPMFVYEAYSYVLQVIGLFVLYLFMKHALNIQYKLAA